MYDIIIVGAGTAGLSAAIYGQRAGKNVLILEALTYGGQIINTPEIENYPVIKNISGFEFAMNLYEQATSLGAKLIYEKVEKIEDKVDIKLVYTNSNVYEAKAVILATGAKNRMLGLENEKEWVGMGISYCATCDGAFFKNSVVAVAGGGNTAIEDAMFLSNYCEKVYVIHRRDVFRAEKATIEALKKRDNVEFITNKRISKLIGDNSLSGLEIEDVNTGEKSNLSVNGLFVAIGQVPENQNFANIVDLDANGYIIAGEDTYTKTKGIFVAGDTRTKTVRQLVTAASDGATAALKAVEYIGI